MRSLLELLALRGGGVISLVGGGGKTTLMFALANELADGGERVLTTTTTKILPPTAEQSAQVLIAPSAEALLSQVAKISHAQRHITAARTRLSDQNKLAGFAPADIEQIGKAGVFPWIIVEADGAGRRPLKAPAAHEPVIPPSSRWVVAVVGLDAAGMPLTEEWVFRSHLYADITGLAPGEPITAQSIALALTHERGIFKGAPHGATRIVFLNKADTENQREQGREIVSYLKDMAQGRPDRIVMASLQGKPGPAESYDLSGPSPVPSGDGTGEVSRSEQAMNRQPTAGIVLAAGMSTRMGSDKQLLDAGGKPLLAWTLEAALHSDLALVVLVLGHEAENIRHALGRLASHGRLKIVVNKQYREGMATSLHAGLRALGNRYPSVMFLLGDQPLFGTDNINLLLDRFRASDKDICAPVCGEERGNPVIFSSFFYDKILGIRGDKGARKLLHTHPCYVLSVEIDDASCFLDIDSPEDAAQLLPLLRARSRPSSRRRPVAARKK